MLIDKHTIKIIGSRYDHKKDKRFKATFIGTEFGDDTQTEISGDEVIEEDEEDNEDE